MTNEINAGRWKEVTRIYAAVVARPVAERANAVAVLCRDDAELRREIESLLDESADGRHVLDGAPFTAGEVLNELHMTPGTMIGVYRIVDLLGVGGMGEVYRARDTKLNRDVAIKILPPAVAHDPDRLARFKREAQVLASLNHPNIGGIYGFEESGSVHALVLELVEGPTLADMLDEAESRKPKALSASESLAIAGQIANALEAAHALGVIHRDLKPANIKVRADGTVKVLDFGLAKITEPDGVAGRQAGVTNSPTITTPAMTAAGIILGTAAYMSPEQAKGRPANQRSDIWSFGCVLYEMLTGTRPFAGEDVAEVLASVLAREPDWTRLPKGLPNTLVLFLKRCLHKDPRQRIGDMQDIRLALEGVFEASDAVPPSQVVTPMSRRMAMPVLVALVAAGVGAAVWFVTRPELPRVVRTVINTSGTAALGPYQGDPDVAITPDGTQVVYRTNNGLVVRALDRLEPRVLNGLGTPRGPFISPDGQSIGFFDGTVMKRVPIAGGPVTTIAAIGDNPRGATWGPDDTIIFATGTIASGLQRVNAAGGQPEVLTTANHATELDHVWPEFLPGGRAVLFTVPSITRSPQMTQVAVLDLQTGISTVLVTGGSHGHYLPSGHLIYAASGTLLAVPFDLERLTLKGTPTPVLEGVLTSATGAANIAVAGNGTLVYLPGRGDGGGQLTVMSMDREGNASVLPNLPLDSYRDVRFSPDGSKLALATQNDILIYDIARENPSRLTTDPAPDIAPLWTPNGERIVFTARRAGYSELFWRRADGAGSEDRLLTRDTVLIDLKPDAWSFDGTQLLFSRVSSSTQGVASIVASIEQLSIANPTESKVLIKNDFNGGRTAVSPDGHWIAYDSNRSGRYEIYVERYPEMRERQAISAGGGRLPLWGPDGKELFFSSLDGRQMFVVPVQSGSTFVPGKPRVLFEPRMQPILGGSRPADIARNGRFAIIRNAELEDGGPVSYLVVVQNWFEELKRLVPLK